MSHSVHPYAHRLGLIRDWQSRWFGRRGAYREYLRSDILIREFLEKRLRGLSVDKVEIERGTNFYRVTVKTARPGLVIGRSGEGATKLRNEILALLAKHQLARPKEFKLDIEEVRQPESHAAIAAGLVVEGLEKRLSFKRVLKQAIEKVMANKQVQGVKVVVAGRLGGTDIARTESMKKGRLPLQTLRADIDFARARALLSYGVIGVKVWIYRGEIFT
ncbi:MAG: 30S ribosomal protein S3 [Candidatus Vogelbacteria bacterium]|nr:30S ribosomal protein S3 [Candidatus Vogelbacteria bacterium]